jgi:hypothetical protein
MKQEILKLVNQIKESLKSIDREGVSHPLIDDVYEKLELIEDEIYEDDAQANALSFDNSNPLILHANLKLFLNFLYDF